MFASTPPPIGTTLFSCCKYQLYVTESKQKSEQRMSDYPEVERTDEEIDAAIEAKRAGRKKPGRAKNANYLPWAEAKEYIQSEMIPSRGKYMEWWDRNQPKTIPRFPYRVYTDENEWVSWNDFLGNQNKFNAKIGTRWRPFAEANKWALGLGIKTQAQWFDFCKTDGKLPADIPARPDLVYEIWRSWNHWLGNRPVEAIQAAQEVAKIQVYYIIHESHNHQNILTFGVEPLGPTALKARWEREQFNVVRMYWYDSTKAAVIREIVDAFSTPYQGSERQRLVTNQWEIVYNLEMHLDQVRRMPE